MKIRRLVVDQLPPIRQFDISGLSSPVIVAGANGSGKTRLKEAIANTFRNPGSPQVSLTIGATRTKETDAWDSAPLEVVQGSKCPALQEYMQSRTRGGAYVGTVIHIDSERSVQPVKFQPITVATPDPYDTDITLTYYLSLFANRWPDLVNKIYQKVANQDLKIANFARHNPTAMCKEGLDANPDPFLPYQQVFGKLLPGKNLEPIDPKQPREFHYRIEDSGPLPFQSLSAGEQEVVKVAFDLIWKRIRHSVILLDEPELHLHPTLAFRLVETLKDLGEGTNQLFLFTHSPDLISTYYATGNVYFIDLRQETGNQGRRLSDLHDAHCETARAVGANLGLFAVGKKLVFIEGTEASVDRLTYHKVVQQCSFDAYLLPLGSVKNVNALRDVSEELGKAIFGVDLFMIRDRDGLTSDQVAKLEGNPRFRVLPRRHVENYFLDAEVLSKVAKQLYLPAAKADPRAIENELLECAQGCLNTAILSELKEFVQLSGAIEAPRVKNPSETDIDALVSSVGTQLTAAVDRLTRVFSESEIRKFVDEKRIRLSAALKNGSWRKEFPGKAVLARFAGGYWGEELGRVRQAYVDIALDEKPEALQEIRDIFCHFEQLTERSAAVGS